MYLSGIIADNKISWRFSTSKTDKDKNPIKHILFKIRYTFVHEIQKIKKTIKRSTKRESKIRQRGFLREHSRENQSVDNGHVHDIHSHTLRYHLCGNGWKRGVSVLDLGAFCGRRALRAHLLILASQIWANSRQKSVRDQGRGRENP